MEDIQEVYTSTLQAYIDVHRPKNRTVFARLLMKLTDLRTLGSEHADMLFALKLQDNNGCGDLVPGSNTNLDDSMSQAADGSLTFKTGTKSCPSKKSSSTKQQPSEIINNAEHHHHVSVNSSGYRMPNVRIKVEPLSSSTTASGGDSGVAGSLNEGDLHSTYESHFSEHPEHIHSDNGAMLQQASSCTYPEYAKMNNLYFEPHQ